MKTLLKSLALASFVMIGALAMGVFVNPGKAIAQDQEQPAQAEEQNEESQEQPAAAPATYNYIAQRGDSYTKISRKAVQTYGIVKKVNLSQAQIVAAETFLTQTAGSPTLSVGQALNVSEADVDAAVKKAQGLSEAQVKLWEKYVPSVNFNTNNVGQAQA